MFFNTLLTLAIMLFDQSAAQTWSTCNPLTTTSCPANPALGKSIAIDFTQGSVNSFTALGNPTYDNNGVSFTVAKQGDAPQLISIFYIMFGKVEITMKAAPGAGIVSTLVLQSDDLDEIDMEWLGADDMEVQTNYFGKGDITTYNRGQFNPAANNQNQFITYTIEWTESQIIWKVGGTIIRVLTPDTADANQYPQSPMQVKFGAWSGGDSSNPSGTIDWARGPTNYANGPFTMLVKSLSVTDYSTGTEYSYGDQSGDWTSIQAKDGAINGNAGGKAATVTGADVPAATSASPSIPAGLGDDSNGNTATRTGWPWVASPTTATTEPTYTGSTAGIPAGWIITSEGKVVPASSAAPKETIFSGRWPSASTSSGHTQASETITGWDDRGLGTTITRPSGFSTIVKSYNDQGSLVTPQAPILTQNLAKADQSDFVDIVTSFTSTSSEVPTKSSVGAAPNQTGSRRIHRVAAGVLGIVAYVFY